MREYVHLIVLLMVCILCVSVTDIDSRTLDSSEKKSGNGSTIIICGVTSVVAAVGGFFLYKKMARKRAHADSIIGIVESAWKRSAELYAAEKYPDAIETLQKITAVWHEYDSYRTTYRRRLSVNADSIEAVIASCDFLQSMIESVNALNLYAEQLPEDEFALTKMSRYDINSRYAHLQTSIDSIISIYPNHAAALRYSFRHILQRLQIVDSLTDAVYLQQKKNFEVKNRFFYNRAVEHGDTAALHRFVDDCDYYRVEKEWCQRARLASAGTRSQNELSMFPSNHVSKKDSIAHAFSYVIRSQNIEALEAYIKKYNTRKYERYSRYTRLSEVNAALRQLRKKIDKRVSYNKQYPLIDITNKTGITLKTKGLSGETEKILQKVWRTLDHYKVRLTKIRMPMTLDIDYTKDPPAIQFDAIVNPLYDIENTNVNGRDAYSILCLDPLVALLHKLKISVIEVLKQDTGNKMERQVKEFQAKKVKYAVYIMRLMNPQNNGTIIFYAKDKKDMGAVIEYYGFYDIAVSGYPMKRFPVYSSSLPMLIPSMSTDTLEEKMTRRFFSGN